MGDVRMAMCRGCETLDLLPNLITATSLDDNLPAHWYHHDHVPSGYAAGMIWAAIADAPLVARNRLGGVDRRPLVLTGAAVVVSAASLLLHLLE